MTPPKHDWSRRKFIATISATGAALVLHPAFSWAMNDEDARIAKIVANTMGIDTHNHVDVPFNMEQFKTQQYNLGNQLKLSGLAAMCMTFCVDRPGLTKEGEAYERFILSLDEMDQILKTNNLTRAFNYADIKNARKNNIPVVIQSIEGGHFIEGKLERIQVAYNRGVRHLGLMHDAQTSPPMGDIYTDAPQYGGLTELGISVIEECNKLGILVDLAHCSNDGINKAIEVSAKPMIISHTGLNTQVGTNERMAKMMMPRLISKEQAKIFATSGGVIGVWTHLADSPIDYANNVRALVDVVGVEHVCIGTDTKMAAPPNDGHDRREGPGGPPRQDNNGNNNRPKDNDNRPKGNDNRPQGNDNNGVGKRGGNTTNTAWADQRQGFYYAVVRALLEAGFTEDEIGKIGGGNYLRLFDAATSGKS